jgi:sulfite exporter TauE/SafE
VLGATASLNAPKSQRGGVLGAVTNVAGSTLPFTGFPLWIAVLIAVVLIAAGLMVRGRGRGPATRI